MPTCSLPRLPLLLLLLLAISNYAAAQHGMQSSSVDYQDFDFPQYAQPWSIGKNVCAFLATANGTRIYTSCFAFQQKVCKQATKFLYDCCPQYGHNEEFVGYTKSDKWQHDYNCLQYLSDEQRESGEDNSKYLDFIGLQPEIQSIARMALSKTSGKVTIFLPYNASYKSERFTSQPRQPIPVIVAGNHLAANLKDGDLKPYAKSLAPFGELAGISVVHHSNGIVTANCKMLSSVDHVIDGRAVVHLVDGFAFGEQQTMLSLLQSQHQYFYADLPASLRALMQSSSCKQKLTVLVPSAAAWASAKSGRNVEELVRKHIFYNSICTAAVCQSDLTVEDLNGEETLIGCDTSGTFAKSILHLDNPAKVYFAAQKGEFGVSTDAGVVYALDGALVHSDAELEDKLWKDGDVDPACTSLKADQQYIFLIPTQAAWSRWANYPGQISKSEAMAKFYQKYTSDADYRCLVRNYHILEADSAEQQQLWSQHNQVAWPAEQRKPGSFKTLASAQIDGSDAFLRNHAHMQRSDDGPRMHFQFAPVQQHKGIKLKNGRGYLVDWVNVAPTESAAEFFARRPDLSLHKKLMDLEAKDAEADGSVPVYKRERSVQLIIAAKDEWYKNKLTDNDLKSVKNYYNAIANNWNRTDHLRLNLGNQYFWLGDLGYLGKGERVYIQSGNPMIEIGVYRHSQDGERYFLWQQVKGEDLPMDEAKAKWSEVIEYNHFKQDAMIWLVDKPLLCTKKLCKNYHKGKTRLPWSFATACGNYVSMTGALAKNVKPIYMAAAGKIGSIVQRNINATLKSGPEAGQTKTVSCFGIAMIMTRNFVMDHDDGLV